MGLLCKVKKYISYKKKVNRFKNNWREKNQHNFTTINEIIPDVVSVGNGTYGNIDIRWFCNKNESLEIGNFCSIAEGVTFLTGGNHHLDRLSSFPFDAYYNTGYSNLAPTKGKIIIHDDVWIGWGATILSGVTIGQGAVIAAKSIVTKDVPPYALYAGNRIAKYRFDEETINKLLKFDYSKLTKEDIEKNHNVLCSKIDDSFFESDFYKSHIK